MKIVVTGTRGIPGVMGGVETHCEELFPRLAARGFDVTVVRRSAYVADGLGEWRGVRLVDVESPRKKSLEAIVHTFRAINEAKRLGADILHIHAIGPALLVPYAKALGMRVVFTHHGPDYDRDKWGRAAKAMLKLGERMGCTFADDVIVISDVIRNLIKRKYGRTERVHLIYNGVSQPEICGYPEYFRELGIEKGKYILGMCRFVPEKNLHHLVAAYAKLKSEERRVKNQDAGVKLVLAGDTDFEDGYSRSLKEMARENGVVLTGFVKGRNDAQYHDSNMKKRNRLGNYFHTIDSNDNMFFALHRMKQPSGTYLAGDTAASVGNQKGQSCWAFSPSYALDTQTVGLHLAHDERANVGAADGHVTSMNKVELNRCPFNFRYMLSQGLVPVTISDDVD